MFRPFAAIMGAFKKVAQTTGLEQAKKDVFDLAGVPAFREFYNLGIFPWKWIYRGYYKLWHFVPAPTINDPRAHRDLERLNMAKFICQELASMIWSDKCNISVTQTGYKPDDKHPDLLQRFIDDVLTDNNFSTKMQEHVEQTLALGGGAVKVWCEPVYQTGADGNPVPDSNGVPLVDASQPPKIKIGYAMADQFVPLSWTNADVSDGLFISRQARGGYYYTTLEWHQWDGTTYVIRNQLYRSDMKKGADGEQQDILGFQRPLDEVYKFLQPSTSVNGLTRSLFSYYRPSGANNMDDNSPLGVSVYANCLSTLKALDIAFDSFVREFTLGRKRIIVPASAIRKVIDPESGAITRYFDANDEVYQALSSDDQNQLKIQDNSVEIRYQEHIDSINALLAILSEQLGMEAGAFAFDVHSGGTSIPQTATAVMMDKQKTYKTIVANELSLKSAIEKMIDNIIDIAVLYNVEYQGVPIKSLVAGGYEKDISFDESVVQDRSANIAEGVTLVGAGLMSKRRMMIDKLGYTPEEADAELAQMAKEGQVTGGTIDDLLSPVQPGQPEAPGSPPQSGDNVPDSAPPGESA